MPVRYRWGAVPPLVGCRYADSAAMDTHVVVIMATTGSLWATLRQLGSRDRAPKRLRAILIAAAVLALAWLLGDFVYSAAAARWMRAWEVTINRDDRGVQRECSALTLGRGATALLLIHGINDSPRCYHKMGPALADLGFTCRAMRLPGFAEPIPRYAQATMEDWIAAVKREVLSLRQDHDRVAIVAHSLGAAVAIAYLLEEPDAADCAVLLAPAVEVSNRRSPLLSTRVWHEIGRRLLLFTSITYSPFPNDCHDPRERDYPGRMPFTPLAIVDQTFRLIDNNRGRAGEFETPLLMVVTKDDCVIDWQAAARFYEQAPASPKTLKLLANSGHAIPVDYDWEIVTREIAEFVRATGLSKFEKRSHTSSNE